MAAVVPQIVCGVFYVADSYAKAEAEFKWSIRQNAEFWRSAVLFADRESAQRLHRHFGAFREVVVDDRLPEVVDRHRRWNCKGWWAQRAVERFGRVLYCDFDIYVRRPIDPALAARLDRSPMFLDIPLYRTPNKAVGCGCVFYDETTRWEPFLDLLYHKWHHDERAWTEALAMVPEKLYADGRHMNPYVVDQSWLLQNSARRDEAYIIHGISPCDDGRALLRRIGYRRREARFHSTLSRDFEEGLRRVRRRLGALKRRLLLTRSHA